MTKNSFNYKVQVPAKVYYTLLDPKEPPNSIARKTKTLLSKADFLSVVEPKTLVALKQHFGEKGNKGFIRPEITKVVADLIKSRAGKPLLVETNTLYYGERSNTYDHLMQAHQHGFSIDKIGIPVAILDGVNGQNQHQVAIPGEIYQKVNMVSDLPFFNSMFVLTHVKGHMLAGMGGAIKNLGMGFTSRAGKLAQHDNYRPEIDRNKCISCGLCTQHCPEGALFLEEGKLNFVETKCIGCGECYTACTSDAISFNWGASGADFHRRMVEHAFGAVIGHPGKAVFVNFFNHITKQCDCWGESNPVVYRDVGIFASQDPVAADKAAYDVGNEVLGEDVFKSLWPGIDSLEQLRHGEKIGLGTQEYELVEV